MMIKLLLLIGVIILSYAENNSPHEPFNDKTTTQSPSVEKSETPDCSHLSKQEKEFASKLSAIHKTMFCNHFSLSQRLRAMALVSTEMQDLTEKNTPITPDEAVEAIMKDARKNQGEIFYDDHHNQESLHSDSYLNSHSKDTTSKRYSN